jgi:hypothetical protein
MQRFYADKERGISIRLFAELCGISYGHFHDVFIYGKEPLTENVQAQGRQKPINEWNAGNVKIMKRQGQHPLCGLQKDISARIYAQNGVANDLRGHQS